MSDSDESRIMRGPRSTQMVFAALARGKKNKKRTVLTMEKREERTKKQSLCSQNSFSRISIDRHVVVRYKTVYKSRFGIGKNSALCLPEKTIKSRQLNYSFSVLKLV